MKTLLHKGITSKIDFIKLLILAVIIGATIYCVYGLLTEGEVTWMAKRAFLCFLNGVIQALIIVFFATKRPNKIVKY